MLIAYDNGNEELKKYQYAQSYLDAEIGTLQDNLKVKEDEARHYLEEASKYRQALEEIREVVSGNYEILDPQAKKEIESKINEVLND